MDGPEIKEIKLRAGDGLQLRSVEIPRFAGPNYLEKAFSVISKGLSNGLFGLSSPEFSLHRRRIAELAVKIVFHPYRETANFQMREASCHTGHNTPTCTGGCHPCREDFERDEPADWPFEQPRKFEFIINLKTDKHIGLGIPPNVLTIADRVIR